MWHLRASSWILSGAVLLASGAALGQAHEAEQAETLFQSGRQLLLDGQHDAACDKLSASQRIDPSVGTLLNLATCRERSGPASAAWRTWLQAAEAAKAQGQAARESLARQRAAALRRKLGTLSFEVPDAARIHAISIMLDGVLLGPADWAREAPIDEGPHTIFAAAPGRVSWSRTIEVRAGTRFTIEIPELTRDARSAGVTTPEPAPSAARTAPVVPTRTTPERPPIAWFAGLVALGVGLLVLVARARRRATRALEASGEPKLALSATLTSAPHTRAAGMAASLLLVASLTYFAWNQWTPAASQTPSRDASPHAPRAARTLRVAGDPWSGYSTFRNNPRLVSELARHDIHLEYVDQPALYEQGERMRALADGELDLAVTTMDAFLQHGAKHTRNGQYPGVIVWNIDESNGGDAIFLAKGRAGFDSVRPTDKVCYAAGTPSEHLWDFASTSFQNLGARLATENGVVASDCWAKLMAGRVQIAVLWQPSTALATKAGYPLAFATGGHADDVIVDVMVANRDVLRREPDLLTTLGRVYFDVIGHYVERPEEHAAFITQDCGSDCGGDRELGRAVLTGIDFLTYEENLCLWWGRCGLPPKMVETLRKTARLLAAKGKLAPAEVPEPSTVLDDRLLRRLQEDPQSRAAQALAKSKAAQKREPTRERVYAYAAARQSHAPQAQVGTLRLPSIYFPEGGAELDQNARSVVAVVAEQLRAFPALCVRVSGHTSSAGDALKNQRLSERRAQAIVEHLTALDAKAFPPVRFETRGFGAAMPVLHETQEDRNASRRTEFLLFHCDNVSVAEASAAANSAPLLE